MILFCIVWGATFGKHHFWFLPNLTEDVGFFDSFKPLYKHDVVSGEKEDGGDKNKDSAETSENPKKTGSKENDNEESKKENEDADKSDENGQAKADWSPSGSEVDNDNGYEIVDPEDVGEKQQNSEDDEPKKTK